MLFVEICFFMVLGRFRSSGRLQNTTRIHLDIAVVGLTLPNIEKSQYSCFWECQCTGNDPQNLAFCAGPPQNTFIIFFDIPERYVFQNGLLPI